MPSFLSRGHNKIDTTPINTEHTKEELHSYGFEVCDFSKSHQTK